MIAASGGTIPFWALSLTYWLHMVATVIWIGGLVALVILVLPVARRTLDNKTFAVFLDNLQRRLDPLGWLSLALLLTTGLFQMSANPNYEGFLTFSNRWAISILVKHILFAGMILVSVYMTWWLLPSLRRIALLREKGLDPQSAEKLANREIWLLRVNLILGLLILGLTAIARVS
jgi:uncharacterized membrane protein